MKRNSFAASRGGSGGKSGPPGLSIPFQDLDGRSQAEQDADFSPTHFIRISTASMLIYTLLYHVGRGLYELR